MDWKLFVAGFIGSWVGIYIDRRQRKKRRCVCGQMDCPGDE
jgi:hypothetical protein